MTVKLNETEIILQGRNNNILKLLSSLNGNGSYVLSPRALSNSMAGLITLV